MLPIVVRLRRFSPAWPGGRKVPSAARPAGHHQLDRADDGDKAVGARCGRTDTVKAERVGGCEGLENAGARGQQATETGGHRGFQSRLIPTCMMVDNPRHLCEHPRAQRHISVHSSPPTSYSRR